MVLALVLAVMVLMVVIIETAVTAGKSVTVETGLPVEMVGTVEVL